MKRLEELPRITEQSLGGLVAGQDLKNRILNAAESTSVRTRPVWRAAIPALSCVLVLAIALGVGIPSLTTRSQPFATVDPLIQSGALGNEDIRNERALLDLNSGDIVITQSDRKPAYRSIWADSKNGSFPLIGVNGSFYRMLTSPESVDSRLLGRSVGTVSEFTTEPALSGTDAVISNKVPAGTAVYAVKGMENTLVCAAVDGSNRLFQRVSFNGSALVGKEKLSDTLQISGHVTAMELSDVGAIIDSKICNDLANTLLKNASYESSGSISGKQSLLIALDNGLTLQLDVKKDKIAGCGVWSCPEFFEAFAAAVK